jgi:hypothetical protein
MRDLNGVNTAASCQVLAAVKLFVVCNGCPTLLNGVSMCSPGGVVSRVIADYNFLRDWISLLTRHLIKLAGSIPQCIKICKSSSYNRTLKGAASIVHGGTVPSIINSMLLYTKIPQYNGAAPFSHKVSQVMTKNRNIATCLKGIFCCMIRSSILSPLPCKSPVSSSERRKRS